MQAFDSFIPGDISLERSGTLGQCAFSHAFTTQSSVCFAEVALCLLRDRLALPGLVCSSDLQGNGGPEPTPKVSVFLPGREGGLWRSYSIPQKLPQLQTVGRPQDARAPPEGRRLLIGAGAGRAAAQLLIGCEESGAVGRVDGSDPGGSE